MPIMKIIEEHEIAIWNIYKMNKTGNGIRTVE